MSHTIDVEIDEATGEITFHVKGIKGKGCKKLIEELAREFGADGAPRVKYTSEYYAAETAVTRKVGR